MNYHTKSYRKKNGIPLDLPVHYKNIWFARLPSITQMIQCGFSYIEMAKHYKCPVSALTVAMSYHGIRSREVRRAHCQELARLQA
jgi:hypothetical protein